MKKLMILGASILQLPAINKAKMMGLDVIAVDMNPNAEGFKVSGIKKEIISTTDIPEVIRIAKKYNIDGIMTLASDMPMRTVAAVVKEMNLIGIDNDTAIKATDKYKMRTALMKMNVPIPEFIKVNSKEEFYCAVDKIRNSGKECIIKPVDNSGSRGIWLLNNYKKDMLDKAYEYSIQYSKNGELMIEEYMNGVEVSVETLSLNNECNIIQITDKLTTGAPYFVEMGHSQPSFLSKEIQEEICKVAIAANKAIGINIGPSHTEIKVTEDGPKVVELGARLGGDNISTYLTQFSTGVDMVECCINIALGLPINIERNWDKGAAIRYFESDTGRIKSVKGLDFANNIPEVKELKMVFNVGDYVRPVRSSTDRVGFVISQSKTAADAIKVCEKVLENVKIEVD
jgi:phosphoribosylglycinamide synthetase, ATP-grasp (A) domain